MLSFFKKSITLDQLSGLVGWLGYKTASGESVSVKNSLQVTAVFCAARVLAEGISQIPVRVIRDEYREDKLFRVVERGHSAHRLLSVRPNEWMTSFEFREYAILAAVLDKGFLAIKNSAGGRVVELLPVPMGAWSVQQRPDYSLEFQVNYADQTVGTFERDQVFFLRGPGVDTFSALSAVQAAREAIGLSRVMEKQQGRLAGNGGKPSGVLSFTQPLKPETKEKLRETWQEKYGPNGDGGVAILDSDAKFQSMTMTSVDAQHLETRKHQIEEVARAFRVHPIMLMHSNNTTTFASAEQHFRNHVIHSLGPWMRRFEEVCNRDILNNEPGLRVDLDERGLLRGDFKDQAEYYTKALGAGGQPGWMTPNEVRAERDMNPVNEDWANEVPRGAMTPESGQDAV